MTVNPHLSDEQRDVVKKVEALLRLAGKNTSEHEAASATAKAMELLASYNLDMSSVGTGDADGARAQQNFVGGYYDFQRDLWEAVADLNFCMYWTQRTQVLRPEALRPNLTAQQVAYWDARRKTEVQHKLVGRRVNVASSQVMAEYLLSAVERLTREFVAGHRTLVGDEGKVVGLGGLLRNNRAMSFRRGVVSTVTDKIYERRRDLIAAEERELVEVQRRAEETAASQSGTSSQALTVSRLRQSEQDANQDFVYGEGFSARVRAERAARAAARKRAEDELTAWALAHPEEAAKQEADRLREQRRRDSRRASRPARYRVSASDKTDWSAFSAGQRAGSTVSVDQQASSGRSHGVGHVAKLGA